jgi:sulfur carrier protein ThiS
MKITLKLYATLRDYLPVEQLGVADLQLDESGTVPDALAAVGVPLGQAHIVLLNGRHVLRPDIPTRSLRDGDVLAVFPAIGGG